MKPVSSSIAHEFFKRSGVLKLVRAADPDVVPGATHETKVFKAMTSWRGDEAFWKRQREALGILGRSVQEGGLDPVALKKYKKQVFDNVHYVTVFIRKNFTLPDCVLPRQLAKHLKTHARFNKISIRQIERYIDEAQTVLAILKTVK